MRTQTSAPPPKMRFEFGEVVLVPFPFTSQIATVPTKAPLTPTLSHARLPSVARESLRAGRGSPPSSRHRCALSPNCNQAYSIRAEFALKQRVVAASACSQDPQMTCRRP
jgi:hypothetical protein